MIDRWARIAIGILVALSLVVFGLSFGFYLGVRADRAGREPLSIETDAEGFHAVEQAYEDILAKSVDPPPKKQLQRAAIRAMIDVLRRSEDPYALFYSPEELTHFEELSTGRFDGIGVALKDKGGRIEIVSVLPAAPAKKVGLRIGDVIRAVDGVPVSQMTTDEAVAGIKGPAGTKVQLTIERAGERKTYTIERASVRLPTVEASLGDHELGYIRLFQFARGAGDQVHAEVNEMIGAGARGVILDLRDNGGGLFTEAVDVASVFIEDGRVVTYRERGSADRSFDARGDAFEEIPLVVLVNEGTASASEIVAGALQDADRAIVVGTTTFGKGSVQEVLRLSDASAMKITTGTYVTPDGETINGRGIAPDVRVAGPPGEQRRRALAVLRELVAGEPRAGLMS